MEVVPVRKLPISNFFTTDIPKVLRAEQIRGISADPPNLGLPMHGEHQWGITFC